MIVLLFIRLARNGHDGGAHQERKLHVILSRPTFHVFQSAREVRIEVTARLRVRDRLAVDYMYLPLVRYNGAFSYNSIFMIRGLTFSFSRV